MLPYLPIAWNRAVVFQHLKMSFNGPGFSREFKPMTEFRDFQQSFKILNWKQLLSSALFTKMQLLKSEILWQKNCTNAVAGGNTRPNLCFAVCGQGSQQSEITLVGLLNWKQLLLFRIVLQGSNYWIERYFAKEEMQLANLCFAAV